MMLQVDGTNGRARVHAEFMLEENERNSREQTTKLKRTFTCRGQSK